MSLQVYDVEDNLMRDSCRCHANDQRQARDWNQKVNSRGDGADVGTGIESSPARRLEFSSVVSR